VQTKSSTRPRVSGRARSLHALSSLWLMGVHVRRCGAVDGFRVIYDREVSVEVRQSEDEDADVGQLQSIRAKILITVGGDVVRAASTSAGRSAPPAGKLCVCGRLPPCAPLSTVGCADFWSRCAKGEEKKPDVVRVECSSEADLFFHFFHSLDAQGLHEARCRPHRGHAPSQRSASSRAARSS
jgi:hypothetical protein